MKDYLSNNFRGDSIPSSLKINFKEGVISILEFALQNGTEFFQFMPDKTLAEVNPHIGGPFDHFTAYVILNKEIIENQHYISTTIIKMLRD